MLRFLSDTAIPPTNKQAERDARPARTRQKISGVATRLLGRGQLVEYGEEFVDPLAGNVSQVLGKSLPVFRGWHLSWRQGRERFADLFDRQPYALRSLDHRDPAKHVGEETALIPGSALAGQEPAIVIPAHCRRRDIHSLGYLTDGQPAHVPVVALHTATVASSALDFNLS